MKSKLMMQALFGASILLGSDGLGLAVEMMEDNPPGKSAVPVDPVEEAYTLVNRVDSMRDLEVPMVKLGCIPALRSLAPGIKREKIALSPDEVVEILRKVKVDGMPIRLGMDVRVLRATASLRAALGPRKLVTLPPDVARLDDDLDKLKETAGDPKLAVRVRQALVAKLNREGYNDQARALSGKEPPATVEESGTVRDLEDLGSRLTQRLLDDWNREQSEVKTRWVRWIAFAEKAPGAVRIPPPPQGTRKDDRGEIDDDEFLKKIEEAIGPPPLSAAERTLALLLHRKGMDVYRVAADLKSVRELSSH